MAQIYYERAMRESGKILAPVYLLSLYGKWQRLNLSDTMWRFLGVGSITGQIYLLMSVGGYILTIMGLVKYLRSEFTTGNS